MRLRTKLAIYTAKLISILIKLLHRGSGATLPGYAAHKIDPDILSAMSGMVHGKVIAVMGTNGKTTTSSILTHALRQDGKKVVSNQTGANMRNGIICAFALAADWRGRLDADYACIEVDENASLHVLPLLKPDCIVITNLSRDQLDRYGEVDIVRDRIIAAISSVPDARLVLNSDDVISYTLSYVCRNPVTTYGISEQIFDSSACSESRESIFCRACGAKLEYDAFYYGHIGIWHCPSCGASRPAPQHSASGISLHDGSYSFCLDGTPVRSGARAPYNVYNTLAAYTALNSIGISTPKQFAAATETFDYANNREDIFRIDGARVQLHLAKNPIGFQQKVSLILQDPEPKDVIIQINDTAQDGRDISWLWDVDFQYLANANAASISLCGTRRYDMGLRLKYEDIPHGFTSDMRGTVKKLAAEGTGNLYIVVNYSGLYQLVGILTELQKGERHHGTKNRASVSRSA